MQQKPRFATICRAVSKIQISNAAIEIWWENSIVMEKEVFANTILEFYPSYVKKEILKKVVNDGLVINNKKKDGQVTLNLTNSVDVTNDATLDDKFQRMLAYENILAAVEEYEYKKPYRQFCYFQYSDLSIERIENLVKDGHINVFNKKDQKVIDDFEKPTIYILEDCLYFKFSKRLTNDVGSTIKHVFLAIIDKSAKLLEIRFDRIGIAYKNSYMYYKDMIGEVLDFFENDVGLEIDNIDFKAVVEYIKAEKEDITVIAQRMERNGTTAYLETYEDDGSVIPILGELDAFIVENETLFGKDQYTQELRQKLVDFKKEIEVKSDMPLVKIRLDASGVKFGITHQYKGADYSLFMLYGELIGEEMMDGVRDYIMQCYQELGNKISASSLSKTEV